VTSVSGRVKGEAARRVEVSGHDGEQRWRQSVVLRNLIIQCLESDRVSSSRC
jgi:hypothetical protein